MKLIRSGTEAEATTVLPSTVDWTAVSGIQVWSVKHVRSRRLSAPAGLDIAWIEKAGVRYATAHRLAAEHDKPVQRGGRAVDELLRERGY